MGFLRTKDGLAGLFMTLWGLFVCLYALTQYQMGNLARIGPGFYPAVLGALLTVLGIVIIARSWWQSAETITVDFRTAALVLGSLCVAALVVEFFGVVPAASMLVLIASTASGKMPVWTNLIYSAILVAAVIGLFVFALRINLVLFRWPL